MEYILLSLSLRNPRGSWFSRNMAVRPRSRYIEGRNAISETRSIEVRRGEEIMFGENACLKSELNGDTNISIFTRVLKNKVH